MIGLKTKNAACHIMSKVNPALLKRFTIRLKRSEKLGIPMIFLNLYTISIEFWITNTLLHKIFHTDMIFFDQFKVPTIRFGKFFKISVEFFIDQKKIIYYSFPFISFFTISIQ